MLIDYPALRRQIPIERVLALIGYSATSRRGQQLRGECPFQTAEASHRGCFSVHLGNGLFRCFHCGAQGNQLDLWAQWRGLSLYHAAIDLCHHTRVDIPLLDRNSAAQ
jgi:DNA primase